jgi:hypothetical protein
MKVSKFLVLGMFQFILLLNFSFDVAYFIFYIFDIIMIHF